MRGLEERRILGSSHAFAKRGRSMGGAGSSPASSAVLCCSRDALPFGSRLNVSDGASGVVEASDAVNVVARVRFPDAP